MRATIDGNEAAASVAYRLNEVCCIYPITPSSPMAELADEWSMQRRPNLWGTAPPSLCISITPGTPPSRLGRPLLDHTSASSAIGDDGVIGKMQQTSLSR